MGDEGDDEAARKAAVAKTKRSTALRNFTRANNMLTKLMSNEKTAQDMLEKQFDKFLEAWNTLEAAHGDYLEIAEVEDDEYLNDPEAAMQAGYVEYNDSSSVLQLEISWISSSIWLSIVDVNHVVSSAQTPPVIRSERFPPSVTGQEQIQNLGSSQL